MEAHDGFSMAVSRGSAPCTVSILPASAWSEGDAISTFRSLQRPERVGFVRPVAFAVAGNVSRTRPFPPTPPTREQLDCSAASVGAGTATRSGYTVGTAPVHAVQHQAVRVDVQIGGLAESLDQRDRAAVGLVGAESGPPQQASRDHSVHHLQHERHEVGAVQAEAGAAGWATAAPTAAPAHGGWRGPLGRPPSASNSSLTIRGRSGSSLDLSLRDEGRSVLLHQSIERGLFRAVALVVDGCAIRCPLGLPADGLHTRLPRW